MTDKQIPPMPTNPPATHDWWDRLYTDDADDTGRPAKAPATADRLPDWRKGETVDLGDGDDEDDGQEHEADPGDANEEEDEGEGQQHAEPVPPAGVWFIPAPDYYPTSQPYLEAAKAGVALSPKTRALLYNLGAAGTGWAFGLVPFMSDSIADCGRNYSISGALVLGLGGLAVVAHFWDRRTRHWWGPFAWVARIPLASIVTALALYAPASQL
ncbi:hypothetical protein [Streptomyces demainii]|uniref:Uncharacterized protein n=1 Tax=Streptomyces demainii TaxID=588122 RepID=A0ABT9KKZ2_9ACTN|nr:hypothetical protein [Streptomyces demainii]MDP9608855.1 hypothetical protein [Streptomyces demainii]